MKTFPWGGVTLAKFAAVAAVVGMAGTSSQAQISVTNNNSVITVNPSNSIGMSAWKINGVNILNQQSFYYKTGSSTSPISALNLTGTSTSGGTLTTTYANSSFSLSILYSLVGGSSASGASDLSEQISIQNLQGTTLTGFRFYQFASFIGAGDVNLSENARGLFNEAYVANGLVNVTESVDTALTPANEGETDANTLANVMAGNTLNDTTSSTLGLWAFEWDETIAGNGTVILSKDLGAIVPEPSTWALFSLGLGIVAFQVYRRRAVKTLVPVKA